jgi:hypothetical protein
MSLKFWKRNSKDPLLRVILDKYRLNLLSLPRENAAIGDLYFVDGNTQQASTPGSISNFLVPVFEIPQITNELMADVAGMTSRNVSEKIGLDLLEGFLNALGMTGAGIGTKVRGSYEATNTQTICFQFTNATRDYVDPILFGNKLDGFRINERNPLYSARRRYYVVTGVARCSSISIKAQGDNKKDANGYVKPIQAITGSGGISVENSGQGQLTFKGEKSLAFGVELYELKYDIGDNRFKMEIMKDVLVMRDRNKDKKEQLKKPRPTLVGHPIKGHVFISVAS